MILNKELQVYIENSIFPQYNMNEEGHNLEHINYVINRCFELSKDMSLNFNMLYVIAAYHDIGYHLDYKNHEIVSAEIMFKDDNLKKFFDDNELIIMKEAIEDHRASLGGKPRSIYGEIVSSADRNIDVEDSLKRVYLYSVKYLGYDGDKTIEECYNHIKNKFDKDGYVKFYFKDEKYERYLKEMRELINDKRNFIKRMEEIISKI